MSSASKRVRRFLKEVTADRRILATSGNGIKGFLELTVEDLREVLEEKKYWKARAERAEAALQPVQVTNTNDAVAALQDVLNRSNSIEQVTLDRQVAWQLLRRAKENDEATEEMLRKRLLQYGEFEKAVRQALRLTPTYRMQNPPKLSPSADDIAFAPEN